MNTSGEYQSWHFEDSNEVFESYYSGLEFKEWKENTLKKMGIYI